MKLILTKLALCTAIYVGKRTVIDVDVMDDFRLARNYQNHREPDYADYMVPSARLMHYDPQQPCYSFIWSLQEYDWITGNRFLPYCDDDGFYKPIQCHFSDYGQSRCWCVDKQGRAIKDSHEKLITIVGRVNELFT